jgi:thymidylate synthase
MIAQQTGLVAKEFIWTGGDCHLYNNHFTQVQTQLAREPLPLPQLVIKRKPDSIFDYEFEDFEIVNYQHHEAIRAQVAV